MFHWIDGLLHSIDIGAFNDRVLVLVWTRSEADDFNYKVDRTAKRQLKPEHSDGKSVVAKTELNRSSCLKQFLPCWSSLMVKADSYHPFNAYTFTWLSFAGWWAGCMQITDHYWPCMVVSGRLYAGNGPLHFPSPDSRNWLKNQNLWSFFPWSQLIELPIKWTASIGARDKAVSS